MSQGALCLILARSWGHRLALGSSGRLGPPGVKQGVSVLSHACRSRPDFVRSFAGLWTGLGDGRKVAVRDRAGKMWRGMDDVEKVS